MLLYMLLFSFAVFYASIELWRPYGHFRSFHARHGKNKLNWIEMNWNMRSFYSHSYSENAIYHCDPTANILDIVQYIVLHPFFSTKPFLIKLFKNFKEQIGSFLNITGDS